MVGEGQPLDAHTPAKMGSGAKPQKENLVGETELPEAGSGDAAQTP